MFSPRFRPSAHGLESLIVTVVVRRSKQSRVPGWEKGVIPGAESQREYILPSRLNPTLSNNGARVIANQFRLQHASLIPPSRPKSSSQHGTFNWLRNKFAKADSSPLKRFGMTNVKGLAVR